MYFYLRVLHLLLMALWLAASLLSALDALAARSDRFPSRAHTRAAGLMGSAAGIGTVATGVALLFLLGGFSSTPWPIHAGLSLGIVMVLVGAAGIGKNTEALRKIDISGQTKRPPPQLVTRLHRWAIVQLLLWFIVFLLMCLRHTL